MKQINSDQPRRRGRPRKEGETKQSSVRIRPSLQRQLAMAAQQSGLSVAAELEKRLELAFTETQMGEETRSLLNRIAVRINDIEAGAGSSSGSAAWDKSLRTWTMVREVLANGPILENVPHPDPAKMRNVAAKNSQQVALRAERQSISGSLRAMGINADAGPNPTLGEILMAAIHEPTRDDAHGAIDEREDLPEDIRAHLHNQVDRLVDVDRELVKIHDHFKVALAPYVEARRAARELLYGANGQPDLPMWLTAPIGFEDEPPGSGFAQTERRLQALMR